VRNLKVKAWLVALLIALLPCVAGAAGMGRINVLSSIGQPLVAEIELSVSNEELTSLDARLALPDAYQQANLQYSTALTGARVTIEKRPNGSSFLRIVTTRSVVEPFIDLLVHLTWTAGRLSREYTALLDPPGIPPSPVPAPSPLISALPQPQPRPAPAMEAPAAVATPVPVPAPPVVPESSVVVSKPISPAPVAAPVPTKVVREYGPIERGETLGKIAQNVKPDGVTLEQMLVALYRSNPEAFIQKNLNLVRTGKILRVPDTEEVEAISRADATQEYRTHVADWNAYRQKVADAAGTVPAEGRTAVSGKITAKVEDKAAAGAPKDVVKLSKGEPPAGTAGGKGKPRAGAERVRALEEEVVSREKALAEANSRVTQLEKTIKDMQKLVELKSPAPAPATKPEAKAAPRPEAAKSETKKPEAVAAKPAPTVQPEASKPEAAAGESQAPSEKPAVVQPEPAKPVAATEPKPKPKPAAAPQRPEPDLMDQVMAAATDPLYLAGGGVVLLGGLAFWLARRRRSRAGEDGPPIAPTLSRAAAAAAGAAANTEEAAAASQDSTEPGTDEVDPLAEAEVYIQYGRDGQAEEILKEALAASPRRGDVQLKLLEIYSARKDKTAFSKLSGDFHKLTGARGESWLKAAAMGYALDPGNPLYEAGKGQAIAAIPHDTHTSTDVDLDIGAGGSTSTDITLEAGAAVAASGFDSTVVDLGAVDGGGASVPAAGSALPEFTLDVPPAGSGGEFDAPLGAVPPARDSNMIDFHIDLPRAGLVDQPTVTPASSNTNSGLDFKLEGLNLSLDGESKTQPGASGEKDGHWYDVQTKFDLAKAYQEMGDRDGAREILQEVIKEGDADQKAQAKTLLDSLG
jgi:pilus assembly protein FimV